MAIKELLAKIDGQQRRMDQMRPLASETVTSLRNYYKIGLTWSSNAMEGNTLTESETKVVIEDGLTIGGKPLRDHLEAYGHAEAFQEMMERIQKQEIAEVDILKMHHLFYRKIDPENAGLYRKSKVFISGSHYPLLDPDKVPDLMKELIAIIEINRNSEHPVLTAAKAHLEFVFIHPFVDGNGRVARLVMNLILLQEGYNMGLSGFLKRKTTIKGRCLSMETSCARMGPRVARRSTGGFHAAHTAHIEADKAV